jgi:hypothetical protein
VASRIENKAHSQESPGGDLTRLSPRHLGLVSLGAVSSSRFIEPDRRISRIRLSVRVLAIIFENFCLSQQPQAMRCLGLTTNGRKVTRRDP